MQRWRRIRGLLGTAITWGVVGAGIGFAMFVARYQPWSISAGYWGRMARLLVGFVGGGALWGTACGLAFGMVLWGAGRSQRFKSLTALQITLWGAIGGAAFPLLLYTPVVLLRGAYSAIPLYGMLTGISAILGAVCGRAVFALARRAPDSIGAPELIADASFSQDLDVRMDTAEQRGKVGV